MFLPNTDRVVLLPVSVETNACCSVLTGENMELKKDTIGHLSLFYSLHGIADETMMQAVTFIFFFIAVFFCAVGPVLSMSKWQMTTSQAVSIRLNRAACGWFRGLFWTVTFCSPECLLKTATGKWV